MDRIRGNLTRTQEPETLGPAHQLRDPRLCVDSTHTEEEKQRAPDTHRGADLMLTHHQDHCSPPLCLPVTRETMGGVRFKNLSFWKCRQPTALHSVALLGRLSCSLSPWLPFQVLIYSFMETSDTLVLLSPAVFSCL